MDMADASSTADTSPADSDLVALSGWKAFHQDLYQTNQLFLRQLYVLNHHFNEFLMLVTGGVVGITRRDGPSCDFDPAHRFPSIIAADADSSHDSDSPSVVLGLVQAVITHLTQVAWHGRARARNHGAWVSILQQVFQAMPAAADWFIRFVCHGNTVLPAETDESLLVEYLFRCNDYYARTALVRLLSAAAVAVAAVDKDQLFAECGFAPDSESDGMEPSTKTSRAGMDTANAIVELVHKLTTMVQTVTREPSKHWRNADEVFLLVQLLAEGQPVLRSYLLSKNMVPRIVYTVIGKRSPTNVVDFVETSGSWMQSTTPETVDVDEDIYQSELDPTKPLEAVAALVNVPQLHRVPLLVEDAETHYEELSARAVAAFGDLFDEHSSHQFMTMHDLQNYMEDAGSQGIMQSKQYLTSVVLRYSKSSDHFLTKDSFLEFIRDLAMENPKEIWSQLTHLGFRNDLTRDDSVSVAGADAVPHEPPRVPSPTGAAAASAEAEPLMLPELTLSALTCAAFYQVALEHNEASVPRIVKQICGHNTVTSQALAQSCLEDMHNLLASSAVRGRRDREAGFRRLTQLLRCLMNLRDELQRERMNHIFFESHVSLVKCARGALGDDAPDGIPGDSGPMTYGRGATINATHYFNAMKTFIRCRPIAEFLYEPDVLAWWGWMSGVFLPIKPAARPPRLEDGTFVDKVNFDVEVVGAGTQDVNGVYRRVASHDNCPVWQKHGVGHTYSLFRCQLNNYTHQWYLSECPFGSVPGTKDDVDYYACQSAHRSQVKISPFEPLIPQTGWNPDGRGQPPAPQIKYCQPVDPELEAMAHDVSAGMERGPSMDPNVNGVDMHDDMEDGDDDSESDDRTSDVDPADLENEGPQDIQDPSLNFDMPGDGPY